MVQDLRHKEHNMLYIGGQEVQHLSVGFRGTTQPTAKAATTLALWDRHQKLHLYSGQVALQPLPGR